MPRVLTLAAMGAVLAWAVMVFIAFDGPASAGRFSVDLPWMPSLGVSLRFAVDGLNVYLLLLTALLFPVVLLCAWTTAESRSGLWLGLMLALEAALLGTFLSQNLVVFFVLWEAVLIPMVLLIAVFGGPQRRRVALTFFLYTMAGSVLFLAAVILLGFQASQQIGHWTFDIDTLVRMRLGYGTQLFVFWAIVLACAVKSPLFPFHSWLPLAYGEASPSGTVLMAGLMSKMGAFGFIKLAIPLCPDVAPAMAPTMVALAVLSILYGAVMALRQQDFKLLVAYASLSHMGYIVLGVFSFQATAAQGALMQILSHGLSVAGLFLLLGLLEQRCGREYLRLSALASRAPRMAVVLMLFVLASLALPLSSGFTAEFLILLGAFTQGLAVWRAGAGAGVLLAALLASAGVVLGATYMLRFARALVFGDASPIGHDARLRDLNLREAAALAPLLLLILWLGIAPAGSMAKVEAAVAVLATPSARAVPALAAAPGAIGPSPAAPVAAAPVEVTRGN
jgi:NADH-quinone oxidoreductase subunit M